MKVFIDTNVILDVLGQREPFFGDSARVWEFVEKGHIRGYLSATSLTDIFYILKKHLGQDGAHESLGKLMLVFGVVSVSEADIKRALKLGLRDFGDALQLTCARKVAIDFLITRNKQDYPKEAAEIITPGDFLLKCQQIDKTMPKRQDR